MVKSFIYRLGLKQKKFSYISVNIEI